MLLLEIGFWRSALKLNDKDVKNVRTPKDAQAILIRSAGSDLSHVMGSRFSQTVLACLTGKLEAQDGRRMDLRNDVIDVLEQLAM